MLIYLNVKGGGGEEICMAETETDWGLAFLLRFSFSTDVKSGECRVTSAEGRVQSGEWRMQSEIVG